MKLSCKNGEDNEGTGEMSEDRVTEVEIRVIVEGTNLDTRIVSDIEEGEREMKMIVESTRIKEGREEGVGKEREGRGEEMRGREAGRAGEESG